MDMTLYFFIEDMRVLTYFPPPFFRLYGLLSIRFYLHTQPTHPHPSLTLAPRTRTLSSLAVHVARTLATISISIYDGRSTLERTPPPDLRIVFVPLVVVSFRLSTHYLGLGVDLFLELLVQYGLDFKRIALAMPGQVRSSPFPDQINYALTYL